MRTDLEAMIGYLAGREGNDAARFRTELDDPSSEASRFLDATRRKSRALVGDDLAGPPTPQAHGPRRARARRPVAVAATAALALVLAATAALFQSGEARGRRLEATLARREAESRAESRRLEASLARALGPRHDANARGGPGGEPIALALGRVEDGLGKLERRLDGLSARPTAPANAPDMPAAPGPDPALAEIRAELAALRREAAAGEQATARQIQELRSVLQEVNQIVRRALARPQPGANPGFPGGQAGVDPAQVQALANGLLSSMAPIRLEAVEGLARLGPAGRPALPDLRAMIHRETDPRVRAAAQAALAILQSD